MKKKFFSFIILVFVTSLLFSCDDKDSKNDVPVLENKRRIECERRVPLCNNKDAMRFYQSIPLIAQDPNGNITVRDVWHSFVVCCEDFQRIMDTLTAYNRIFDSTGFYPAPISKETTIGRIKVSASISYLDEWHSKRLEWLSFGDSTMTWSMPTGKYFEAHKRELEEAHARCCLL